MQSRFIFKEMSIAYLGLGSNLGDKVLNLDMTIQQIALEAGALLGISTFYQTEPWGFDSENDFLNAQHIFWQLNHRAPHPAEGVLVFLVPTHFDPLARNNFKGFF